MDEADNSRIELSNKSLLLLLLCSHSSAFLVSSAAAVANLVWYDMESGRMDVVEVD